jgi:hypothetical protein
MTAPLGLAGEPPAIDIERNPARNRNCRSNNGLRVAIAKRSRVAARSRAAKSAMINTGTDSRCAVDACSPAAILAASTTRLPVMWAMNKAPSPRDPITSTLPARSSARISTTSCRAGRRPIPRSEMFSSAVQVVLTPGRPAGRRAIGSARRHRQAEAPAPGPGRRCKRRPVRPHAARRRKSARAAGR